MASDRRIVIELKVVGGDGGNGGGSTTTSTTNIDNTNIHVDSTQININSLIHPIKSAETALLGKSILVNQAYGYAKQAVKSSITYGINKHFTLNEDYIGEQTMQNALNTIGKVGSLAASVGAGFVFGGVPGAVIAGVGFGVNETIQVFQKYDRVNMQLAEVNLQSQFQRVRLGLVDGGKGTQN